MKRTYIALLLTTVSLSIGSEAMAAEISVDGIEEAAEISSDRIQEEESSEPVFPEAYEAEEVISERSLDSSPADPVMGNDLESLIPADKKRPAGFTADTWKELKLVNRERHKAGAEPLSGFKEFQDMAALRTREIKKKFSHTRPNGEVCDTAYPLDGFGIGENIAMGQDSVEKAVGWWMNSKKHRENILRPDYVHIAIGASDKYYVQGFALPYPGYEGINAIYVLDEQRIIKKKGKISNLGIVVMLESPSGYSYVPLEDYMCSGYDPSTEGIYDVTVTIRGCETTFPLIVSSNGKNITIDELPDVDPESSAWTDILATGQTLSPESYAGTSEDIVKYAISSGKKNITLSKKGKIKAKKAGYAVITTYIKDGYIYRASERYLIRIENPKFTVKTISITADETATASDYMAGADDFPLITYASSNPKIATVDAETGVITGIKKGNTKITALFSNGESTVKRTVKVKVSKFPV